MRLVQKVFFVDRVKRFFFKEFFFWWWLGREFWLDFRSGVSNFFSLNTVRRVGLGVRRFFVFYNKPFGFLQVNVVLLVVAVLFGWLFWFWFFLMGCFLGWYLWRRSNTLWRKEFNDRFWKFWKVK